MSYLSSPYRTTASTDEKFALIEQIVSGRQLDVVTELCPKSGIGYENDSLSTALPEYFDPS
jgi:hypothetical protein